MTEATKKAVLMVHLDPDLKKELALQAVWEGRSMSEIVRYAVATYIRVNRLQVQELLDRFTTPEAEAERQRYIQEERHRRVARVVGNSYVPVTPIIHHPEEA